VADNVVLPGTGSSVATDEIGGNQFQRMKLTLGADGVNDGDVSSGNPLPVSGDFYPATQPVSIAVPVAVTGGLTDAELRAAAIAVLGPLTDAELRALPLVVTDTTAAELLDGLQTLLLRLLNATNSPRGYDVALGRNRMTAILESGTITTVSTVAAVNGVANIGSLGNQQAQLLTNGQNASAWAATVRSRIT
jgi:hypothetical protein